MSRVGFRGNRAISQSIIEALLGEGFSNSQITDFLQLNKLSYTAQSMRNDINRIRTELVAGDIMKSLDYNDMIPDRLMRTRYIDHKAPYSTVYKFEYFNRESGKMEESGFTAYFNENPSQWDIIQQWEELQGSIETLYPYENLVLKKTYNYKNVRTPPRG